MVEQAPAPRASLSAWFIRHPIGTSLIMAGLLVLGIASFPKLPVAPLPEVDFPTLQVSTSLPGASPEIIASSVTQPLERQFGEIPGVSQMTSISTLGNSAITLQFNLNVDINAAAELVQTAINAASGQLPTDLPAPPTYREVNPADPPILVLGLTSRTLPIIRVDDYAENVLEQRISQIAGVGQVLVFGQQKPSVRIQVDPAKVASLGLSLEDLRQAIVSNTVNGPKGTVQGRTRTF
ncbi:MAG: acriflavine resistance protein B, partial [Azorhizobium sp. 39-67-5]